MFLLHDAPELHSLKTCGTAHGVSYCVLTGSYQQMDSVEALRCGNVK